MSALPIATRLASITSRAGAVALALALLPDGASALALGASASGYASGSYIVGCTTCPWGEIAMSGTPVTQAGGNGESQAEVHYAGRGLSQTLVPTDPTLGGASYDARAYVQGGLALPVVKARASADNEQVWRATPSGPQFVGIDTYGVSANAQALQRYTYLGTSTASYTFTFHVDGQLQGSLGSVSARAALFDGNDPFLEVPLTSHTAFADGVDTSLLDEVFSLTVELDPGESVLLLASLSVGVMSSYSSEDSSVDAWNTFQATGIVGNTALLRAEVPAVPSTPNDVPEPASALLAGVALLALSARRRGRPRAGQATG